jgi:hypothetical protein
LIFLFYKSHIFGGTNKNWAQIDWKNEIQLKEEPSILSSFKCFFSNSTPTNNKQKESCCDQRSLPPLRNAVGFCERKRKKKKCKKK